MSGKQNILVPPGRMARVSRSEEHSTRFYRSTNLDRDFYADDALENYCLTDSILGYAARVVDGLRQGSALRAWRIIGPYGCGKSSFALALARHLSGKTMPKRLPALPKFDMALTPILVTCTKAPLAQAVIKGVESFNGNTELLIAQREEDGTPLFFSPMKNAPHTLIAGGTGSGKSVLMQNILLGITATNTPAQAQIILIDPKMVDFSDFEQAPHLCEPIITDQARALQVLTSAVTEMDRRYEVLRDNKVKDIVGLRKKGESATEQFPVLWIIHDEFAEWMLTESYQSGVSDIVSRLGVKARAAGIYLVFAAQRPDATVMPMQLRDNLGNRLVLKVNSEGTSDIALGETGAGAERLLGKGHLMAKLDGVLGITVAQVPFVDDTSVALMLTEIRNA